MPALIVAIPAAIALAWLALRGGRRRGARDEDVAGVNGALEPGRTGALEASADEEPFRRRELPTMSGGEIGGPYGPGTQEQAPSGVDGYSEAPGPTQTITAVGTSYVRGLIAGAPTSPSYTPQPSSPIYVAPPQPSPSTSPVYSPTFTSSPYVGGTIKAV